jgi:hypothetical protein
MNTNNDEPHFVPVQVSKTVSPICVSGWDQEQPAHKIPLRLNHPPNNMARCLTYFNDINSGLWIVKLGNKIDKGSTTAPGV